MRYLNTKKENTMTTLFAKGKTLLAVAVGFFAAVGILSLVHIGPAQASTSPGVNLAMLVSRLSAAEATILSQGTTIASQGTTIDSLHKAIVSQDNAISALKATIAPISLSGTDLTIKGVNVHIVSGRGYTDDGTQGEVPDATLSGLGNLIIGYNELRSDGTDSRTGSHNIVTGSENNYSSYGGLVTGAFNAISDQYATVSGGYSNTASGPYASVGGGNNNMAITDYASVSGGYSNIASGYSASVSGGFTNTASSRLRLGYRWPLQQGQRRLCLGQRRRRQRG
jgi:hypothetical protein